MEVFTIIAGIMSTIGGIAATFAWLQSKRLRDEYKEEQNRLAKNITIALQHGDKKLNLPLDLYRSEFTRAEVLGRIGMIPMKEKRKRFSIGYLNTSDFIKILKKIMMNDGEDIITIPLTKEEYDQFEKFDI